MSIVTNRKVHHDFFLEDRVEVGIVLEGWEIKSIRDGRAQLKDSYVRVKDNELWLLGCHISPVISTSTHVKADADRVKKLLASKSEIRKLKDKVEQKGYSLMALNLHFSKGKVKVDIALAKGKKLYDKRADEKNREAEKEKLHLIKKYKRM